MDNNTVERLHKLFSDRDFLDANKDKRTLDEIFAAVVEVDASITKEDLDQYLLQISENMTSLESNELSADDLDYVAGGSVTLTWAMVAGIIGGTYAVSAAIGEAIAHWKNRKG